MAAVHGRCDERFTALKALAEKLAVQDDDGFALAVEVDGELVVDLWAGRASEASLIHTFSTVKPLSACSLLLLVERCEITLSTALGAIWPEFSTEVATCTIADVLGHRSLDRLLIRTTAGQAGVGNHDGHITGSAPHQRMRASSIGGSHRSHRHQP